MFFSTQKNIWHRETCTHRLHTKVFTDRLFFARRNFTQNSFYTAFFFRTETFTHKKNAQQFLQTDGFYTQKIFRTEVLRREGFTHSIFYIQTLLITHGCLYTDTNCTQKLVHTARVYTLAQILHREALLPLLDHLPFVFPLSRVVFQECVLGLFFLGPDSFEEHCDPNPAGDWRPSPTVGHAQPVAPGTRFLLSFGFPSHTWKPQPLFMRATSS